MTLMGYFWIVVGGVAGTVLATVIAALVPVRFGFDASAVVGSVGATAGMLVAGLWLAGVDR